MHVVAFILASSWKLARRQVNLAWWSSGARTLHHNRNWDFSTWKFKMVAKLSRKIRWNQRVNQRRKWSRLQREILSVDHSISSGVSVNALRNNFAVRGGKARRWVRLTEELRRRACNMTYAKQRLERDKKQSLNLFSHLIGTMSPPAIINGWLCKNSLQKRQISAFQFRFDFTRRMLSLNCEFLIKKLLICKSWDRSRRFWETGLKSARLCLL